MRQRETVAFAGLHRQSHAQPAHDFLRPRPAAQHELVCLELAPGRIDMLDTIHCQAPTSDVGLPNQRGPRFLELVRERRHKAVRREMAVLREIDRARHVHAHARIEGGGLLRGENLGRNAEGAGAEISRCTSPPQPSCTEPPLPKSHNP